MRSFFTVLYMLCLLSYLFLPGKPGAFTHTCGSSRDTIPQGNCITHAPKNPEECWSTYPHMRRLMPPAGHLGGSNSKAATASRRCTAGGLVRRRGVHNPGGIWLYNNMHLTGMKTILVLNPIWVIYANVAHTQNVRCGITCRHKIAVKPNPNLICVVLRCVGPRASQSFLMVSCGNRHVLW